MSSNQHGLNVTRPVSVLNRAIRFSFPDFFKSLTKAVGNGATGNFGRALDNAVDAAFSVGLVQDLGEVAWLLIQRSLLQAVHDLLKDNEALIYRDPENPSVRLTQMGLPPDDPDAVTARLDLSLEQGETVIDENFFLRPRALPVLEQFKTPFKQWLELFGLNAAEADSIAGRLPTYFVHALNEQWRTRPADYERLKGIDTPFTKASAAEQAWQEYAALLQKQVDEPMFVEAFSLRQVYVPLRAYFVERDAKDTAEKEARFDPRAAEAREGRRVVVDLGTELEAWLAGNDAGDAVRIISGGPGSGKSSFTKMLAARLAARGGRRVLFVPLHLLELSDELGEAVGKFIGYVDPALTNPLAPGERAEPFLVVFDGLDELAMQGRVAAELAQQFVREVLRKTDQLNIRSNRLKVLISGRELAVQSNASDFKRPRQILHVLPYFVPEEERKAYADARNLLAPDQRQRWWSNYGKASGFGYEGMPQELGRGELLDVTSQPLLNYLVALSYTRGEVDLAKESNLNVIYRDLLKAVYERGWAKGHNPAVRGVPEDKFVRWLEEIAVAAWHGDGRTTSVEEIRGHVESGGAAGLMSLFEEGADKGITRLLMAFYFRRAGVRESGEKTFEFTHKSFGECLTARRIVRLLRDTHAELARHQEDVDRGWDEREALVRWIRLCGPAALDEYLFKFIENEVRIAGASSASNWQETLCKLIGFELRNGMPMELLNLPTFKEATRQARNAEEGLIVVLNACARVSQKRSNIAWPSTAKSSRNTAFGDLLSRLHGQRGSFRRDVLILNHLGFLNLANQFLVIRDFYEADLSGADLSGADLSGADLGGADLGGADLGRTDLSRAYLSGAFLIGADLTRAYLTGADLTGAYLTGADLSGADLTGTDLAGADLIGAFLTGALLSGTDLRGIRFSKGTNFTGANFEYAEFGSEEQRQKILRLAGSEAEDSETPDGSNEGEGKAP